MSTKELMINIDGIPATSEDIDVISKTDCLNCELMYVFDGPVYFTRLSSKENKLIWWHIDHCTVRRTYSKR